MVITRTPFRVSFFGGGTDFPIFFDECGGAVLNTSIDKYCYITARYLPPFFDHKYRVRYTKREETNSIDDISHPSVRACLQHVDLPYGVEILHTSDIPAMSGIGSSSSFTVGLLNALYTLKGTDITKSELCMEALHIEQTILKENVGSQDQTVAAHGGLNHIQFNKDQAPLVSPVAIPRHRRKELESHLMLFFTGFSRISSVIAKEQIKETPNKHLELLEMKTMVASAMELLMSEHPIEGFGDLLHESWMIKKTLTSHVSAPAIDEFYERARCAGAIGGKLCGAGAGGFLLIFAKPDDQPNVKRALNDLLHVPFAFEDKGSHIIFNQRNNL